MQMQNPMPAQNLSTPFAALLSDRSGRVVQFTLRLDFYRTVCCSVLGPMKAFRNRLLTKSKDFGWYSHKNLGQIGFRPLLFPNLRFARKEQ